MANKLTTNQVAEMLGYSVRHVQALLRLGAIKGEQFGRTWMIDCKEVERIKREQTEGGYYYHGKTTGPKK